MRFFRSSQVRFPSAGWLLLICVQAGSGLNGLSTTVEAPYNAKVHITTTDGAVKREEGRFGVMTHFAQAWNPDLIPLIAEAGIPHVRDELYWNQVEIQKGVFKFPEAYDSYMAELKQKQISPLIILSFENPLYDGGNTPYTQEGFDGYARYAVEVLRHYGDQVKAVEIWNEYNGSFNHGPATSDRAATYLKMLRTAYIAIKRERPDVTVVAGATAGIPMPYWEKLLKGDVLTYADALSIHPYRFSERPEGMQSEILELRALVQRYGIAKPIWVTEIGWQLKGSQAPGDFAIDENTQAKFLVRCYALLLSAGVENIYWYLFRDDQEFTMGLIRSDAARTPKAAYRAMAALSRFLDGATFVKRESTPDELYSMLFRTASGDEKRIMWNSGTRGVVMGGASSATDFLGEPLSVAGSLSMGYSPVFVTGPLRDLPPAPAGQEILADSVHDFYQQDNPVWSYGVYTPGTISMVSLPQFEITDWKAHWTGTYPYVSVSAAEQHPSSAGSVPITAVRRWRSPKDGKVRIIGRFRCGTSGDGVGVSLVVDGTLRFRKLLSTATDVVHEFDRTETVHAGSTIDFAVDPGPGTNFDFDATSVSVVIRNAP